MAEKFSDRWFFPLPRTHTGIPSGNGTMGALVWGSDNILKITLGRADLWDHRGGLEWKREMNLATLTRLLETRDEKSLQEIFEQTTPAPGQPKRPSILPIGRLELYLPEGKNLVSGQVEYLTGQVTVFAGGRKLLPITFCLSLYENLLVVRWTPELQPVKIAGRPSWEFLSQYLSSISFPSPEFFSTEGVSGWVQKRPGDTPYCVAYQINGCQLSIATAVADSPAQAITRAKTLFLKLEKKSDFLRRKNSLWWKNYWSTVPAINLPNEKLQFVYRYGLYRFAGFTNPAGVPATLQGPWIEEYQMPPWSSDYHFNINVQLCYAPAYQTGKLQHLKPLFQMVWSWRERLQHNAYLFCGIKDGYILPHAVDDRGISMGGFWTGTIDHGCTAWVAKMMYDYWLYGGEKDFLAEVAFPFMAGAMRVFEAMLKRRGESWYLPVSVSPEYRGSSINAWGANSSFQLACIHWLIEALVNTCEVLKQKVNPLWLDIQKNLPRACVQEKNGQKKIMLWEGTDLEESHRHHSHLAGLVPFDVIDLNDAYWRQVINNTYDWWWRLGMGLWSGWCIPWAAMIHARVGSPEIAEALIEYWQRLYTNQGYASLHDPLIYKRNLVEKPVYRIGENSEVMQMDATMAATAAVMDFLVHTRRGIHYLFCGAPETWREVSFEKIRTPGGFLVSAERIKNITTRIEVTSLRNGTFRLATPWPEKTFARIGKKKISFSGKFLSLSLPAGSTVIFSGRPV